MRNNYRTILPERGSVSANDRDENDSRGRRGANGPASSERAALAAEPTVRRPNSSSGLGSPNSHLSIHNPVQEHTQRHRLTSGAAADPERARSIPRLQCTLSLRSQSPKPRTPAIVWISYPSPKRGTWHVWLRFRFEDLSEFLVMLCPVNEISHPLAFVHLRIPGSDLRQRGFLETSPIPGVSQQAQDPAPGHLDPGTLIHSEGRKSVDSP